MTDSKLHALERDGASDAAVGTVVTSPLKLFVISVPSPVYAHGDLDATVGARFELGLFCATLYMMDDAFG